MARKKKTGTGKLVVQNAVKTLLANIRFASVDEPIRSIVITSSIPNEGKTTIAINLAQAIATSGKRVLLVECDMRHRSLARTIGARAKSGIYAVLTDQVPLEQAVIVTAQQNMSFLDAEPNIPNPADIISSMRFARLVNILEEAYDYVVFDTPPVGTFVDAAVLASLVDATAIVVRDRVTKRDELLNTYEQLTKAGAKVVGAVMNCCDIGTNKYYYYAYYNRRGDRVKPGGRSSELSAVAAVSAPDLAAALPEVPDRHARPHHLR